MKTQDLHAMHLTELSPQEQAAITGGTKDSLAYQFGYAVGRTFGQIAGGYCALMGYWAKTILQGG